MSYEVFVTQWFSNQLLEPAREPISIRHLTIQRGFADNIHGDRTLWVGIDARYLRTLRFILSSFF
jgi:hypothetical protein